MASEYMRTDEKMASVIESAQKAVENQTKACDAAMIAAKAFDRLVTLFEKNQEALRSWVATKKAGEQ